MITATFEESKYPRKWQRGYNRSSDRPDGHSIVYLSVSGEGIWEQMETRRERPYQQLRPYLIDALEEHFGFVPASIRWSQRAGCSCPCSPGWIITGAGVPRGQDFWLNITSETAKALKEVAS